MEKKSVTEILQSFGKFVTAVKGTSMNPLLHAGKETVVILPQNGPLKRFDVPLYQRKNGQHVLHRVMRVEESGYVMCGDSQLELEPNITEDMILGVMAGFFRGERYIAVTSFGYRVYVFFWCRSFLVRRVWLFIKHLILWLRGLS